MSPFSWKRAHTFKAVAKTDGLTSRKVKSLSGSWARPIYWEIWTHEPFFRKKGSWICIGSPSFLLRGKVWSPRISSLFFIDFMSYGVRIEVELLLQNRPPLFLWSLIWTGWKPRFYRFFEDFKERKWSLIVVAVSPPRFSSLKIIKKRVLIVVAVSTAPFSFVENGWRRTEDAYSRDFLRIPKQEKWVDFCLQYRQRHYMLLKMPLYLDLDVFHNIMNGLEAQISSIFRRFQREEMEFNCCCRTDTPIFLLWKLQKKEF